MENLEFSHDYYLVKFIDPGVDATIQTSNKILTVRQLSEFMLTLVKAGFIVLRIEGVSK